MSDKWKRRERKQNKKRNQMKQSGRSVFLIQEIQIKKAQKIKDKKESK